MSANHFHKPCGRKRFIARLTSATFVAMCSCFLGSVHGAVDRIALDALRSSTIEKTKSERRSDLLALVQKLSPTDAPDVVFDLSASLFDELATNDPQNTSRVDLARALTRLSQSTQDAARIDSALLRTSWLASLGALAPQHSTSMPHQFDSSVLETRYRLIAPDTPSDIVVRHLSDVRFVFGIPNQTQDVAFRFRWLNRARRVAATYLSSSASAPWLLEFDLQLGSLLASIGQSSDAQSILEATRVRAASLGAVEVELNVRWAQAQHAFARGESSLAADLFNELVEEYKKSPARLTVDPKLLLEAASANVAVDDCSQTKRLLSDAEKGVSSNASTTHKVTFSLLRSNCAARAGRIAAAKRYLDDAKSLLQLDANLSNKKKIQVAEVELLLAVQQPSLTERARASSAFAVATQEVSARSRPTLSLLASEILDMSEKEQQLAHQERARDLSKLTSDQTKYKRYVDYALFGALLLLSFGVAFILKKILNQTREAKHNATINDPNSGALSRRACLDLLKHDASIFDSLTFLPRSTRYVMIVKLRDLEVVEKSLPTAMVDEGLKDLVTRLARFVGGKKHVGRLRQALFVIVVRNKLRPDVLPIAKQISTELQRRPIMQTAAGHCVTAEIYLTRFSRNEHRLLKNLERIDVPAGTSSDYFVDETIHARQVG
jgi:GGDEF domain-containing protein